MSPIGEPTWAQSGHVTDYVVDVPMMVIRRACLAPAPLVANGGAYAGCSLEVGHDGDHEIRITWSRR